MTENIRIRRVVLKKKEKNIKRKGTLYKRTLFDVSSNDFQLYKRKGEDSNLRAASDKVIDAVLLFNDETWGHFIKICVF